MACEKNIDEEIIKVKSLKTLVEVYGEIASVRVMKVRDSVLENRNFLGAINDIFQDSLASYAKKLSRLLVAGKIKKGKRVTFLAHNGKTVAVLVSANTGFYGEVVGTTFRKFMEEIKDKNVEITIIGKLGRSLFLEKEPKKPYTYFDLPDYQVSQAKLSKVIKHLVAYEKISVYYGKYQSIITQVPTEFTISAGTSVREDVKDPKVQYLFEPSVEKILMFFETEIFASLFDQTIRESQLAKFASRILAMDKAAENIKSDLQKLSLEKLRLEHRLSDRKQLNSLFSAMSGR
jgi:F-type H+-transporting ATPase subunit gamma